MTDLEKTHLINSFKKDLKDLIKKHNISVYESDNYNGMENYCGTDYYFVIDGETWFAQTISEFIDDSF